MWYFLIHFQQYMYIVGVRTRIRTDHQALNWLAKARTEDLTLGHWNADMESLGLPIESDVRSTLETLDWTVEHRPDKRHCNADGLSRKGGTGKKDKRHANCAPAAVNATQLIDEVTKLQEWQNSMDRWTDLITRKQENRLPPLEEEFAGHDNQT